MWFEQFLTTKPLVTNLKSQKLINDATNFIIPLNLLLKIQDEVK